SSPPHTYTLSYTTLFRSVPSRVEVEPRVVAERVDGQAGARPRLAAVERLVDAVVAGEVGQVVAGGVDVIRVGRVDRDRRLALGAALVGDVEVASDQVDAGAVAGSSAPAQGDRAVAGIWRGHSRSRCAPDGGEAGCRRC